MKLQFALLMSALFSVLVFSAAASAALNATKLMDYPVPEELGKLIGDARVNIYDYENRELGSIVILNGTIREVSDGFVEKPTHQIFVDSEATMQSILESDNFIKEFNRQRSLHNIRVEALDFMGQIKLAFGTMVASLVSLFISPE